MGIETLQHSEPCYRWACPEYAKHLAADLLAAEKRAEELEARYELALVYIASERSLGPLHNGIANWRNRIKAEVQAAKGETSHEVPQTASGD